MMILRFTSATDPITPREASTPTILSIRPKCCIGSSLRGCCEDNRVSECYVSFGSDILEDVQFELTWRRAWTRTTHTRSTIVARPLVWLSDAEVRLCRGFLAVSYTHLTLPTKA